MSLKLFLSMMIWTSSSVMTKARITPAMGRITVSDRFSIMLKMPEFHAWGDVPTLTGDVRHLFIDGIEQAG